MRANSIHCKPVLPARAGKSNQAFIAQGFSLVEVVLSLGIASFAMVSLMGLLSLGLKTSREAIDETVQSQMVQTIRNQVLLSSFKDLKTTWKNKNLYFDNQGMQVNSDSSELILFTAIVDVQDVTVSQTPLLASDALNVLVKISSKTAPQTTNTYAVVVANTGW